MLEVFPFMTGKKILKMMKNIQKFCRECKIKHGRIIGLALIYAKFDRFHSTTCLDLGHRFLYIKMLLADRKLGKLVPGLE